HALWSRYVWWPAAGLGVYIAGVTWFARREAGVSSRWQLLGAQGVINLGFAALVAYVVRSRPAVAQFGLDDFQFQVLLTLALIIVIVNRRLITVAFDPVPQKVQPAVKTLL